MQTYFFPVRASAQGSRCRLRVSDPGGLGVGGGSLKARRINLHVNLRIKWTGGLIKWQKVSHFTWCPKPGGRKCRILHGVLSLVVESVVFYVVSSAWWSKV